MEKVEIVIIGAGAVGLAIGYELTLEKKEVLIIEKNEKFGQETSSRNSEVIHSGIYYPKNSLKTLLCIEGKSLLYDFCEKNNIPFKRCGKLIVATEKDEIGDLLKLYENGKGNGVSDLRIIEKSDIKNFVNLLNGEIAIFSPSTGIFDTHKFMQKLEYFIKLNGGIIEYNCEVIGLEKLNNEYKLIVKDADGEIFELKASVIINSAGLNSDKIAKMVGINNYRLYYSKGEYFKLSAKYKNLTDYLIYPVVKKGFKSLGKHIVLDLQGNVKIGPNNFYVNEIDYSVEEGHIEEFYEGIKKFFSFIKKDELSPDTAGIRAKLQGPNDDFADFVIKEESAKGVKNFINLIGIESPGLTSSLAIAKYVKNLL